MENENNLSEKKNIEESTYITKQEPINSKQNPNSDIDYNPNSQNINTELCDESLLATLPDNFKEDYEEENKEKIMVEELSKLIQKESNSKNSVNNNLQLSSRNKSLTDKLNSYRKFIIKCGAYLGKKKQEFLAEISPSIINPFGRNWQEVECDIKEKSKFKNFETYEIKNFIAKANDDLRQELMTMQMIKRFDDIFKAAEVPLKLRPYEILITSPTSGLIEFIPNTISIDALKKKLSPQTSLNIFFRNFFVIKFEEAQKNFTESLAAYSIVQYILNIKDR